MKYFILKDKDVSKARELSERIWAMKHPNQPADYVTKAYTSHISHKDGRVALLVDGVEYESIVEGEAVKTYSDAMLVDPSADTDALIDAVGDAVTAPERAGMKAKLDAAKGKTASLLQFATETPSLQPQLKTREEMEADGWFPDPTI